jgi:hypothetical protein
MLLLLVIELLASVDANAIRLVLLLLVIEH